MRQSLFLPMIPKQYSYFERCIYMLRVLPRLEALRRMIPKIKKEQPGFMLCWSIDNCEKHPLYRKGVIQKYWNKWPLKCSISSWAWAGLCKIKFLFSSWSTLTQRDRRIQSHPLWFLLAFVGRRLYYLWLDLGSRNSSICGLCGHGMGEKVKGKHCFRGFYLVVPLYEPQQYINII